MSDENKNDDLEFQLSQMDVNQIERYRHSDKHNAMRVVVVKQPPIEVKWPENMPPAQTVPQMATEVKIIEIEKPVIVKEIQIIEIEKPIYIDREVKIEVEKPVFIKEVQIVEIEKPVFIKETETVQIEKPLGVTISQSLPKWMPAMFIIQSAAILGLLLLDILKK